MTEQQLPLNQALGLTREPFDKNIPTKHLFISQQIKQLFQQLNQLINPPRSAPLSINWNPTGLTSPILPIPPSASAASSIPSRSSSISKAAISNGNY